MSKASDTASDTASDLEHTAGALYVNILMFLRKLKRPQPGDELTTPETSALARLDRLGPATASALAKAEQISPQAMGVTLAALQAQGLVERRDDPTDGRRITLTATEKGHDTLLRRRSARADLVAKALAEHFTADEVEQLRIAMPLIERLAAAL